MTVDALICFWAGAQEAGQEGWSVSILNRKKKIVMREHQANASNPISFLAPHDYFFSAIPSCAISSASMATSLPVALRSGATHFTGNGRIRFQRLTGSPFSFIRMIATFGLEARWFLLNFPVATSSCHSSKSFELETPRLSVMFPYEDASGNF